MQQLKSEESFATLVDRVRAESAARAEARAQQCGPTKELFLQHQISLSQLMLAERVKAFEAARKAETVELVRALLRDKAPVQPVAKVVSLQPRLKQLNGAVPAKDQSREEWLLRMDELRNTLRPPPGFQKGKHGCWGPAAYLALTTQFNALKELCNYAAAVIEIHKAWGYVNKAGEANGALVKIISAAGKWVESHKGRAYVASLSGSGSAWGKLGGK